MKKTFLAALLVTLAAFAAGALEISLVDPASPDWKKAFSITNPGFSVSASKEEPGVLVIEAKLAETSPVITRKEWHGFNIAFAEPLPGGKLKFDFKPDTLTTMWMTVAGKAPDGTPRRLDKPVNMYGSNLAKPGVWSPVEIDTTKANIVGGKGAGALESVSRLELRLHPSQYTKPGTYRGEIRNLRYEIAE